MGDVPRCPYTEDTDLWRLPRLISGFIVNLFSDVGVKIYNYQIRLYFQPNNVSTALYNLGSNFRKILSRFEQFLQDKRNQYQVGIFNTGYFESSVAMCLYVRTR